MRLEHCQKCSVQVEFFEKGNNRVHDDKKSQMNRLESARRSEGADVNTFWYCNDCWFKMEQVLQDKGYLPRGMSSGFNGE